MSNASVTCTYVVFLLLIVSAEAQWDLKSDVTIYNYVRDSGPLWVHCRSKDDDLGWRKILPEEKFQFRFGESLMQNTLFYCWFLWHEGHNWQVHTVWNRRDTREMPAMCRRCDWRARPKGTFLYDPDQKAFVLGHEWYTNGTWTFPPALAAENITTWVALPAHDHLD